MTNLPIRSMTGYGSSERDHPAGRLRVDVRAVNHRYLNVQIRSPNGFERHHPRVESILRTFLSRGAVTVSVALDRSALEDDRPVVVDSERARGYLKALNELRKETGVDGPVDLAMMASFRDLFRVEERPGPLVELDVDLVEPALEEALRQVVEMRESEGARMAADLAGRLDAMEGQLGVIEERAPQRLLDERDRLRTAVEALLEGSGASVDDERIAREIAHLAEKWDIHEEIVRFRSHLQMFRDTLDSGGSDGVGKRFGFIAQEILREANTMGSKANDPVITHAVVDLKEEIERLREQLENVE